MKLSDAEWRVMKVVWERADASSRDVLDALAADTAWAYTTVKTLLTRLETKGAVTARLVGQTARYRPAVSRDEARGSALQSLVDRAFEGTLGTLLHHMVDRERLSSADLVELRTLLDGAGDDTDDSTQRHT